MATLGVQFVAEMLGMMVAIWMGESVLASELLAQSKGLHMGITGVAIGFGLAFYVAISSFGSVSATLNPCMMFAKWISGKKTTEEWIVLTIADFCGAFLGAILVWLTYFGHFSLIPEVPDDDEVKQIKMAPTTVREAYISNPKGEIRERIGRTDTLRLRKTDAVLKHRATLQVAALQHERDLLANDSGKNNIKEIDERVGQELVDSVRQSRNTPRFPVPTFQQPRHAASFSEKMLKVNQTSVVGDLGQHKLPSTHRRSSDFDAETAANTEANSQTNMQHTSSMKATTAASGPAESVPRASTGAPVQRRGSAVSFVEAVTRDNTHSNTNMQHMMSNASNITTPYVIPDNLIVYEKLLIQDQNAKLSVFATRPAIYHWQTNLLAEIMGTFALIWFALMIEENAFLMANEDQRTSFERQSVPLMIGALVTGCVLAFVGPTGFAANAARDFSPRLFHWVAPIPNKGPSEWHYAWVPFVGPYVGCTIAGLCFVGTRNLLTYPAWSASIVSQQTMFGGLTNVF